MTDLSEIQIARYARHILLPEVGGRGQRQLLQSRVLLVGLGGLGAPAALYLAAAGVGTLGLLDDDRVDLANLQRQVLYRTEDLGRPKVEAALERLAGLNPDVTFEPHPLRLVAENANLIASYDLVLDGSDNFDTRYLVGDACQRWGKAEVFGSVLGFEGQASLFPPGGPCYRCAFPQAPPPDAVPSCAEAGVIGAAAGMIGVIQAAEAIKWLLGRADTLAGRLLLVDVLGMRFDALTLERDPGCPACGRASG